MNILKLIGIVFLFNINIFGETIGCKYQEDLIKLESITINKVKFMFDNHCARIHNGLNWNYLKQEGSFTLIQSPHKNEEHYQYWVESSKLSEKIKINKTVKINNDREILKYGDLIWQDNLINENNMMSFDEAQFYCKNLEYHGIKNWRLPTIDEFIQIRPASWQSKYQPYKDFKYLKLNEWYWSMNSEQFVFSSGATSNSYQYPALVKCVADRK